MSKKIYSRRMNKLKANVGAVKTLKILYKLLPLIIIGIYPIMIIIKALEGFSLNLCLLIFVPAVTLITVTALRKLIDRERPYIKYGIDPVIPKKSTGESFPSRHTASAFIIAMSGFMFSPFLAVTLLTLSAIIGITRIVAGVHYVTDVLAGTLISVGIGTVFFILI